jgi:hypothetical protein
MLDASIIFLRTDSRTSLKLYHIMMFYRMKFKKNTYD